MISFDQHALAERAAAEVGAARAGRPPNTVEEVLCCTTQRYGEAPSAADRVARVPARTMADDTDRHEAAVLPMGSRYEVALLLSDLVAPRARQRAEQSNRAVAARLINVE